MRIDNNFSLLAQLKRALELLGLRHQSNLHENPLVGHFGYKTACYTGGHRFFYSWLHLLKGKSLRKTRGGFNRAMNNLYWHSITLSFYTFLISNRELDNHGCKHNETGGNFWPWWPRSFEPC